MGPMRRLTSSNRLAVKRIHGFWHIAPGLPGVFLFPRQAGGYVSNICVRLRRSMAARSVGAVSSWRRPEMFQPSR